MLYRASEFWRPQQLLNGRIAFRTSCVKILFVEVERIRRICPADGVRPFLVEAAANSLEPSSLSPPSVLPELRGDG
jgi:hypothetical protein